MTVRRSQVALALSVVALLVVSGAPAYAATLISGKTIKAGTVSSKQLADGSVTLAKLAASARTALKGPTGPAGAPGDRGQDGPGGEAGARGAPTAYDIYDRAGTRVGRDLGVASAYQAVLTDEGAVLLYSGDVTDGEPIALGAATLYFKAAGCTGQAYLPPTGFPPEFGVTFASPATPGTTIYVAQPAPFENIASLSHRDLSGCTNASAPVPAALPARTAGVVPTIQKPLVPRTAG